MIIGIVSASNEQHRFYEALLPSHTRLHFTPGEILSGISVSCDGFLLDAGLLNSDRRKLQKLLSRMSNMEVSAVIAREESHPCTLRHNPASGLKFQCGRIAAAKVREMGAVNRCDPERIHTLVFQDVTEGSDSSAESLPD
ncbi:MAG TPA: hypothetical protein VMV75_04510 [Sulfuricella sp.]|nr:hypothetical protein [Sulfuricella sp.]